MSEPDTADTADPAEPPKAAEASKSRPAENGLLWWLGQVGSSILLLAVIAVVAATIVVPKVSGSLPYTVLTQSMRPHYPPGTLVVIKPVADSQLGVGDVITYQIESGKPGVVTHRIISVGYAANGERTFTTQGDNNADPDPKAVRPVQIRGQLWYAVPYLGYLNTWLTGSTRSTLVAILAGGLVSYALWMFVSAAIHRRRPSSTSEKEVTR